MRPHLPMIVASLCALACASFEGGALPGIESFTARMTPEDRKALELESRFGGVLHRGDDSERLRRIARELHEYADDLPVRCELRLLASERPNAFSFPGGRIYLTVGMLRRAETDMLLAAAIAHEMAHVAVQDGLTRAATPAIQLQRELNADRRALRYLGAAGYDCSAIVELLECLETEQPPGWAARRIQYARDILQADAGATCLCASTRPAPR